MWPERILGGLITPEQGIVIGTGVLCACLAAALWLLVTWQLAQDAVEEEMLRRAREMDAVVVEFPERWTGR